MSNSEQESFEEIWMKFYCYKYNNIFVTVEGKTDRTLITLRGSMLPATPLSPHTTFTGSFLLLDETVLTIPQPPQD